MALTTGEEQEGTFDGLSPGVLWLRQPGYGYGVRRVGLDWITGITRLLIRNEA